ncbi:hypothetical protein R6Q57_015565 [Mikania cordata]
MDRYGRFNKFDIVSNHSDHFYSAYKLRIRQQGLEDDWHVNLTKEWKVVQEQLPENIFVRAYQGSVNLLRAVVHYCFDGLQINPNIHLNGSLFMRLPKRDEAGMLLNLERIWVPGTSDMLSFLIFLRNIFNSMTLLNGVLYGHPASFGALQVLFYNEVAFIKSLKTMVAVMNNPP